MINPNNPDYENTPVSPKRPKYEYVLKNKNVKPLVSIITPFYNTGEIFYETAQSIMQQSFQQWEWIIVNDGSTDPNSLEILAYINNLDERVKVVHHVKNCGRSVARNTGCKHSTSDFIVFIDSDDLLEPTTIEKWLWFLQSHKEFAFVNGYVVAFNEQQYLWMNGFDSGKEFIQENKTVNTAMIRKEVVSKINYFDENLSFLEDWDFWLRCAYHGYWGRTIPEYLIWYRRDRVHEWDREEITNNFRKRIYNFYPELDVKFPHITIKPRNRYSEIVRIDKLELENQLVKNKRRILMVIPWMTIGGADNFNLNLVKQLSENDWEVTIVSTEKNNSHDVSYKFYQYTPDIFVLPDLVELNYIPAFFEYLIRSRDFDFVFISNSHIGYQMLPLIKTKFPDLTCLDYNHTIDPGWMNDGYPNLSVLYQKYLDLQMTTSISLSNWMIQRGGNPDKIKECYINVDSNYFSPNENKRINFRREKKIDLDVPLIIFSGRFTPQKQPDVFIKVINNLRNENLNFKAIMLGDGHLYNSCHQLKHDLNLDGVVDMIGAVDVEESLKWFNAADIFFLPSAYEGISLALYEAMSIGLIPVVADVGGQRELVGECGFLVQHDEKEIENYTSILSRILSEIQNYKPIGVSARKRIIERFDISLLYERFSFLINSIKQEKINHGTCDNLLNLFLQEAIENYFMGKVADDIWYVKVQLETDLRNCREQKNSLSMPPATASTYLYFTIRAMFYPLYLKIPASYQKHIAKLRDVLKKMLVGDNH